MQEQDLTFPLLRDEHRNRGLPLSLCYLPYIPPQFRSGYSAHLGNLGDFPDRAGFSALFPRSCRVICLQDHSMYLQEVDMKARNRTFNPKAFIVNWIVFGTMGTGLIFLPLMLMAHG
jgi:hypothetical protein